MAATCTRFPTTLLVLLAVVGLILVKDPRAQGSVGSDRAALVALYNATSGASWRNSTNWLSTEPLGTWHGIGTDTAGRVTSLDLEDNELSGPIPSELGALANLRYLDLGHNELSGPIPPALGALANLIRLHLSGNELSGPIPSELWHLDQPRWAKATALN